MHDRAEGAILERRFGELAVGEIEPVKLETRELTQDREPRFLQRWVVIIIDAVDADDGAAAFQHPPRQAKADETRGAGD